MVRSGTAPVWRCPPPFDDVTPLSNLGSIAGRWALVLVVPHAPTVRQIAAVMAKTRIIE